MAEQLLACPFCGNSAGITEKCSEVGGGFVVFCYICPVSLGETVMIETRDEAIAAWNRRSNPGPESEKEENI